MSSTFASAEARNIPPIRICRNHRRSFLRKETIGLSLCCLMILTKKPLGILTQGPEIGGGFVRKFKLVLLRPAFAEAASRRQVKLRRTLLALSTSGWPATRSSKSRLRAKAASAASAKGGGGGGTDAPSLSAWSGLCLHPRGVRGVLASVMML